MDRRNASALNFAVGSDIISVARPSIAIDKSSAIAAPAAASQKSICDDTYFFFSLAPFESFVAGLFFLGALITMESLLCIRLNGAPSQNMGAIVSLASTQSHL